MAGARKGVLHRSNRGNESSSSKFNQALTSDPSVSTSHPRSLEPNNSKWVPRNRGVKPQFVDKSEVGSSSHEVFSSASLDSEMVSLSIDERVEKEEREGGVCSSSGSKNEVVEEESNDVRGLLEELALSCEEVELSEEQLMSNCQYQDDEILVLQSIYGENVLIFDKQRGLKSFQVHIDIEVPNGITVTTKLNSSGDLKTSGKDVDEFSYSFKVQYLPPVVLTCLLPKSYPSHLPPYFTISVQWLDSIKIANLCSKLDSIWNEQPGQEVLYQWVEWLKYYSLSFMGFDNEIMLGPYGLKHTKDRRVVSGSVSPDIDVPFIRSYNDQRLHESFQRNIHECYICFSEYPGTEFIKLPCQHLFCCKCMKTYSDIHVSEGTVTKLKCPDAKCDCMIPPNLLKGLLSDEEYERWESLTLQKTLESMPDITDCPRCETPCIEDEDQHAQCSQCFFSFCTLCRERRHVGADCMTPELKLQILQDRQNSSQLKEAQKHREREMINEILSLKEIFRDAKQCPSCKMAISRTEGCNKMVCENCGKYFCYRCNKAIDGYDHFRGGTCELFPLAMIQNWEERINQRQIEAQVQVQLYGGGDHGQFCPNCRQFNFKVGNNNHLFCWACQTNYCYLCNKVVRRSSQHYGPKGCKQHTEG